MPKADLSPRERILDAALHLIREDGPEAATTRAVSTAASVQAPTIYRLFGDMRGLLDAVAEREMERYVATKRAKAPGHPEDPVEDLRVGFHEHVAFSLAHPGVFALMSSRSVPSEATKAGADILRHRIQRIAEAGRLRVPVDRAVSLVHTVGTGLIRSLLDQQPSAADRTALAELTCDALLASITSSTSSSSSLLSSKASLAASTPHAAAIALLASLHRVESGVFSSAEVALLRDWLDRIARSKPQRSAQKKATPQTAKKGKKR